MNKYYQKIDKSIQSYENFKPYHDVSIDWICDRINWCWTWRKITKDEMESLCDRVCLILDSIGGAA